MKNSQEKFWSESFGQEYSKRNSYDYNEWNNWFQLNYGVTKEILNKEFLDDLDKDIKVLEVGCNIGQQLFGLEKIGFKNLYGVELQHTAVSVAHSRFPQFNIIQGSGFDLPFKDSYFDLVYTSGVLIHIAPENLSKIMGEMVRVSKKFIWGLEYFSDELTEIPYRGNTNALWKMDYQKKFQDEFGLNELKAKKIPYISKEFEGNVDLMYLLEKS